MHGRPGRPHELRTHGRVLHAGVQRGQAAAHHRGAGPAAVHHPVRRHRVPGAQERVPRRQAVGARQHPGAGGQAVRGQLLRGRRALRRGDHQEGGRRRRAGPRRVRRGRHARQRHPGHQHHVAGREHHVGQAVPQVRSQLLHRACTGGLRGARGLRHARQDRGQGEHGARARVRGHGAPHQRRLRAGRRGAGPRHRRRDRRRRHQGVVPHQAHRHHGQRRRGGPARRRVRAAAAQPVPSRRPRPHLQLCADALLQRRVRGGHPGRPGATAGGLHAHPGLRLAHDQPLGPGLRGLQGGPHLQRRRVHWHGHRVLVRRVLVPGPVLLAADERAALPAAGRGRGRHVRDREQLRPGRPGAPAGPTHAHRPHAGLRGRLHHGDVHDGRVRVPHRQQHHAARAAQLLLLRRVRHLLRLPVPDHVVRGVPHPGRVAPHRQARGLWVLLQRAGHRVLHVLRARAQRQDPHADLDGRVPRRRAHQEVGEGRGGGGVRCPGRRGPRRVRHDGGAGGRQRLLPPRLVRQGLDRGLQHAVPRPGREHRHLHARHAGEHRAGHLAAAGVLGGVQSRPVRGGLLGEQLERRVQHPPQLHGRLRVRRAVRLAQRRRRRQLPLRRSVEERDQQRAERGHRHHPHPRQPRAERQVQRQRQGHGFPAQQPQERAGQRRRRGVRVQRRVAQLRAVQGDRGGGDPQRGVQHSRDGSDHRHPAGQPHGGAGGVLLPGAHHSQHRGLHALLGPHHRQRHGDHAGHRAGALRGLLRAHRARLHGDPGHPQRAPQAVPGRHGRGGVQRSVLHLFGRAYAQRLPVLRVPHLLPPAVPVHLLRPRARPDPAARAHVARRAQRLHPRRTRGRALNGTTARSRHTQTPPDREMSALDDLYNNDGFIQQ
mmetsp:Transcript_17731/g.43856  ORF Transcript_17731/g.43856 Transcript_17731/m.43856 type:complete len:881 (-) Transcript_17731:212-2854(-)